MSPRHRLAVLVTASLVLLSTASATAGAPARIDGEWIVALLDANEGPSDIYRFRPDGSDVVNLTNGTARDAVAALSPDGTTIAFSAATDQGVSLWLMAIDGSNRRMLLDRYASEPVWTPDGRSIVYAGANDIRIVDRDGSNDRAITSVEGSPRNPSVSPDGATVIYDSQIDTTRNIYSVPMAGGEPTQLTDEGGFEASFHPDGDRIVFVTFRGFEGNIWVMNADGSDQRHLIPSDSNDFRPAWSPDGSHVAYESLRSEHTAIVVWEVDSGEQQVVVESADARWRDPRWTAVTLEAIGDPEPTTTTDPTQTPTTSASTTTTMPEVGPTTTVSALPGGRDSAGGVPLLVTALLVAAALGTGVLIGRRLRPAPEPPPPPAP